MNKKLWSLCALLPFVILACSPVRHLHEGEHLLRRSNIQLNTDRIGADKSALNDQLLQLRTQKPNTYLFGIFPYKTWLYNLRYNKYQKDTANYQITSRVVEKPVVLDTARVTKSKMIMQEFLQNQGYFYPRITDTIKYRNSRAYVSFRVHTGSGFLINDVQYDVEDADIRKILTDTRSESLLKKNKYYSNALLSEERNRMADKIRDYGYYHFSAENIFFELDTLHSAAFQFRGNLLQSTLNYLNRHKREHPTLNIKVIVSQGRDNLSFNKFTFGNVTVLPDYVDTADLHDVNMIEKQEEGIRFRFHQDYVHTGILLKKIPIRPGGYYARQDYNKTIRQLNDLGIFKYVRVRFFDDRRDSLHQTLNAYILLNPVKKYDFNTNMEVSGGDIYALGTAATLSVTDRNFLKGANQLTTSLSYGIEMSRDRKIGSGFFDQLYLFSQNFGVNFRLQFPKFILPVNQSRFSPSSLPRTFVGAGFNSMIRPRYFTLQTINISYGYIWKETPLKTWTIRPAFVNTLHLDNVSDSFKLKMDSIPAIRNSYQETFVEGESVEFVFNNELTRPHNNSYLRLAFEEAGLLMGGIKGIGRGMDARFDLNYARYVRLDFDMRQYYRYPRTAFAFRFYGGIGLPYGSSLTLPYIKQYFAGGAYSIRGWRPRVLGPGSYYDTLQQSSLDELFIDQSGDIKLELNGEYRFALIRLFSGAVSLNGALFADAGNVWLARKDSKLPGAEFNLGRLYQDIALSTGAGLRVDFGGFLVVRLDWAFPLKKPYEAQRYGWVLRDINFGDPDWRKNNINFNAAIGYPF